MNPEQNINMYTPPGGFDMKSLGICMITIILNSAPQAATWISSFASILTSVAAVSTVTYNLIKLYIEVKGKRDKIKP